MRIKKLTRGAAASAVALVLAMSLSVSAFAYTDEAAETEESTTQTEMVGTVTTNGSRLNLREGGSTDYSIIGQLVNGDTVTVVGEENGWYQVIVPEKKGYVCGDYLTVSEKTADTANASNTSFDDSNSNALTPDGNMQLVDDVTEESNGKQFITVQSKNDNTFYIVIDHDKDSDNVYFMNLVDEADLMALIEDGEVTVKCTCEERCAAGNVDTTCPVCKSDMTQCTGVEQEEPEESDVKIEPTEEPAQEDSGKTNMTPVLAVLLVMILGAGGAVYYLKLRKQKPDIKGPVDLDDYDFGDEDEDEDEEYVTEDDLPEAEETDDAEYDEE